MESKLRPVWLPAPPVLLPSVLAGLGLSPAPLLALAKRLIHILRPWHRSTKHTTGMLLSNLLTISHFFLFFFFCP